MNNANIIEGRNPVIEALKSGREIEKILISKGNKEGSIKKILAVAKENRIPIQYVDKNKINQISVSHAHQGVIAYVAAYKYYEVDELLERARSKDEEVFLIILDEITDPHNLGSIIRTANAAGAHGIIIPKRRAVGLTATVAKTSAGAIEYVPVSRVTNISRTIDYLKEQGVWIVGADMDGEKLYYESDLKGNVALVIGSEGQGISRLVKKKCDFLVKLPMKGEVTSLNASVAASILMYEILRQRDNS
ncbi:23S rRNA (guanosine2251-2'-O)-methyltransferase [Caminicella sporogenes DSM 14501]|uniref:23S rRNA (Guanosine2251-2'-O)-methyltransferase n=1 Tax=Caminicella sporogenes DSM 14501 TaxID=1121266 RepID=A0A1M6SQL7_9FIRM|nr:23S rRNA (guanosine(2251)-2'-O)-methyltransferase RlmB [Caminicella sporogenes]RKD26427.1 23S rRNA (guanosine(2251)-2'-O)-methyltransferase RlmB [Caminicella sporogenes]SHK46939.1 23S rRNA (guanosine2251-2'-O)-methyltransferase [Caminicella sporogenes DSM 14501]